MFWSLVRKSHQRETSLDPLGNTVPATSGRGHCTEQLHVQYLLHLFLHPVIPKSIVHPQFQQLQWWHEPKLNQPPTHKHTHIHTLLITVHSHNDTNPNQTLSFLCEYFT